MMEPSSKPLPIVLSSTLRTGPRASGAADKELRLKATCRFLLASLCIVLAWPTVGWSAEVEIYRADSSKALSEGTFDGVSVDPRGHLQLARQVTRLGGLEEPFVFTAAGSDDGWIIGSGAGGKVLQVREDGSSEVLATLPEPQVFAVAVAAGGEVYAATSPEGKVYRVRDGLGEELFDPESTYIWDLAVDDDGHLLVATGLPAKVFEVTPKGRSKLLYEAPDVHVRSLLALADGALVMGTAGQGLILQRSADGTIRTLHDAVHPEVVALSRRADGTLYAALLASEASQVSLAAATESTDSSATGDATVTVTETGSETLGSRSGGFKGARSVVIALPPQGGYEDIAQFKDQTVHSVLFHEGELWIGTGEEGKLYRRQGAGVVEERQLEERQIVALAAGRRGAVAVTANGSAVYGIGADPLAEGTYTSKILDMDEMSRFGSFQWQGEAPRGTAIELSFRSGLSSSPDATWSAWRPLACATDCDTAGRRTEISLSDLPNGRFMQWRARLQGKGGVSPRLELVELSYRQVNQRPRIKDLEVLSAGEILVPPTFNAQNQAYEPWSPNRESIFTTLEAATKSESGHLKTLWKRGYRSLKWAAEDANGDTLSYDVHVRTQDGTDADGLWMPVVEETDDSYLSFDSTVLPDGIYIFRLTVQDGTERTGGDGLTARQTTSPVVIDHSAPRWLEGKATDDGYEVEIRDALSPLRQAVFSVDGGEWTAAHAEDGLLDGRRESLRLPVDGTPRILLLRLTDAAHNVVTFNVLSNVQRSGR